MRSAIPLRFAGPLASAPNKPTSFAANRNFDAECRLIPILTPMAIARGIEPIHFGILVETNVALHLACPPAGNVLFTACAVGNTPLETVIKPILPMIGILTVTMLIITYVQDIAMYLPRLLRLVD